MKQIARGFALFSLLASSTFSQVPEKISWQAYLTDGTGQPISGTVNLILNLYESLEGGSYVYQKDTSGVAAVSGVANVPLGPLSPDLLKKPLFLGIRVNGGSELVPRTPFASVPYALTARGFRAYETTDGYNVGMNVIAGHETNTMAAGVVGGTIGGGGAWAADLSYGNRVEDSFGTVGGGVNNRAGSIGATVAGGNYNLADGGNATIGGGSYNTAKGYGAMVCGGGQNKAGGDYSFAGGYNAKVLDAIEAGNDKGHEGTFIWSDRSAPLTAFQSREPNQFLIRAKGGVGIGTSKTDYPFVVGTPFANGDGNGAHLTTNGVWTNGSSRTFKRGFAPIDARDILERVSELPITRWRFKGEDDGEHIGPVAEDFHEAFGIEGDERYIGTADADGVALAAIQGLYEIVQEQQAEIEALRATIEAMDR